MGIRSHGVMSGRPARVALALLVAASGTAIGSFGTSALAQTSPVMFGASARPRGDESQRQAVENLEQAIGRRLGAVRVYKRWDNAFPTDYERWLRATDRVPFLSVAALRNNGDRVSWREIADAPFGSPLHDDMVRWANRVRDFGATVYFTFNHEPEAENRTGNPQQDFIDAWRRIVTVFRNNGVTNARFTWILTAFTFARNDGNGALSWYPGDDYVDAIGADGYNFAGCRAGVSQSWRSFEQIFEPVRAFAAAHPGKEVVVGEWGSVEDPGDPGRKAEWIRAATTTLSSPGWEQFRAVLYWHSEAPFGDPPCRFWVDTSPSSLAAFAEMGANPHFFLGAPPQVASFSPTRGRPGKTVRLSGLNFSSVQSVSFDGVAATFSVESLSGMTTTVPQGATAGPITVQSSFGSGSSSTFSVVHPRAVTLTLEGGRTATGTISTRDGFEACARRQPVSIQRRVPGKDWRTILRTESRADGSYRANVSGAGKYRAQLPRRTLASSDVCGKARSQIRH